MIIKFADKSLTFNSEHIVMTSIEEREIIDKELSLTVLTVFMDNGRTWELYGDKINEFRKQWEQVK